MQLFNPNNTFFRWVARITDVVGLSLLWAFLSVPLVTLGAATAALYESVRTCVRTGDSGAFTRFFAVFRADFRRTWASSLLWSAVWALLLAGFRLLAFLAENGERAALLQLVIFCVLLVIPAGIVCWLFPLCARSAFRGVELNIRAAHLTLAHLPVTLGVLAVTAAGIYLCWRYWTPLFCLPVLCALAHTALMEQVFLREGIVKAESAPEDGNNF